MTVNELVDKIRYNIPNNVLYKQLDWDKQYKAICKILDTGVNVLGVNKPIAYLNEERVLLKTFIIEDYDIIIPNSTETVLIWCWYELLNGKQMINVGYV